jgi:succinoglycan biosynthesis transport protein ExoP
MDLAHDPEFVGNFRDRETQSPIGKLKKAVKQLVGWEVEPPVEPEAALERIAVETFLKRLSVYREDSPGVITITFASEDSKKAARIANSIVDAYLAATSDSKTKSTKVASQLLQDRLVELKQAVDGAYKALQEFRINNNLVNKNTVLLPTEQIVKSLSAKLTAARMQIAEAKARLDRMQQQPSSEDTPGSMFPDNQVVAALRSKYLDLSTRVTELASRVGPDHFALIKLRKEMDDARTAIREEEKRLAALSYQAAQTESYELAAMMEQLSEESKRESKAQITVRELEATAESLRDQYNSVLEKFNTLNTQPLNPIQDARIITRAAPQLQKSSKKSLAVLGGGVVAGLLFGAGGVIAREFVAGVFRTSEQVKQATGLYCVGVPAVEQSGNQITSQAGTNPVILEEFVLDAPHSRFTESFRDVKALLVAAHRAGGDKVIGVVSPVAKNGKSTIAINLATLMATSARTLVIDGDLHRRQLTARLEPDAREGLIEALNDVSRLPPLVIKRPRSGLDFLPCVLSQRISNAAELLGSSQMERLLNAARESYDHIIIECPPIMSVVDVKMVERFIDGFVFVIEWGQTKRRVVQEALDEIDVTRERTLCIVLNKIDPTALRQIEAYKGPEYGAYYQQA